jgi:GrpB-like predicted nucleotidyltransferase (UPF0157 family)
MSTSIDRAAIIAKIKKCLALAKSSNENEAATALRQAQRMMQAHGITDLDIEHADIQEGAARAGAVAKPAQWEGVLSVRVGNAFGCKVFLVGYRGVGHWVFIGPTPSADLARYAFEVLFRQAKRARATYIAMHLNRLGRTNRTRRADRFSEGWVEAATALITQFAGSKEQEARIEAYVAGQGAVVPLAAVDRNAGRPFTSRDYVDVHSGLAAGASAQLNHGVGGSGNRLALGGGAM